MTLTLARIIHWRTQGVTICVYASVILSVTIHLQLKHFLGQIISFLHWTHQWMLHRSRLYPCWARSSNSITYLSAVVTEYSPLTWIPVTRVRVRIKSTAIDVKTFRRNDFHVPDMRDLSYNPFRICVSNLMKNYLKLRFRHSNLGVDGRITLKSWSNSALTHKLRKSTIMK